MFHGLNKINFSMVIILPTLLLGCASGSVRESKGPTILEAKAVPAEGPKARIAVAQFVNNSGGLDAQLQRANVQMQAQMANMAKEALEFQKLMIPYQQALAEWQARVAAVGEKKAGPPPKAPEFNPPSSSPYMTTVTDPVAGGVRDMMINALFRCGKFIVLERQSIETIKWEQEFSRKTQVGNKTSIPLGQIEGAELILIGSINTLEAKQSGGNIGSVIPSAFSSLPYTNIPSTEAQISWESAKVTMELRLVDTRTSRVVAVATVEGKATKVSLSGSRTQYTYDAGTLPQSFSVYHETPVEDAFRKMVNAAVDFLVTKTPVHYYHKR